MNWLLVALGGAIGAVFRYGLGSYFIKSSSTFPWATWSINLLGCFLAGVFFAFSQQYPALQNNARLFLMVGILGGFTTFSSFGLETFNLLREGQALWAIGYAVSSVILGVILLAVGYVIFSYLLQLKT
jgi:CrcB protein